MAMPDKDHRAELFDRLAKQQSASPVRGIPARPGSLKFLARLVDTRKLNRQVLDRINAELAQGMTQEQCTNWIDVLKPLPRTGGRMI